MSRFTFHIDPGHGWLAVLPEDLAALGLNKYDFSTCSYQAAPRKGAMIYLEEDCDAPKFVEAFKKRFGEDSLTIVELHHENESFIRRCAPLH